MAGEHSDGQMRQVILETLPVAAIDDVTSALNRGDVAAEMQAAFVLDNAGLGDVPGLPELMVEMCQARD